MFRNREFRQFFLCYILWFFFALILYMGKETEKTFFLIIVMLGYGGMFYVFTCRRYRRISELSEEIDQVLHHSDKIYISTEDEGELSILESEIAKMTLRIRDQNEALQLERDHLADALADIAHQLRTPLTAAELIIERLDSCENTIERQELLREMSLLYHQMDQLLTALLKLSRLDAGIVLFAKQDVILADLVSNISRRLAVPIELREINLTVNIPKGIIINVDLVWMTEALQNIIKNAIESVAYGGSVIINADETLLYTEICILDNGPGFSQNDLSHIFERFYSGNNSTSSGFGIGLSLSKAIIMRMGGTIKAKNRACGGAAFIIRFPK